jgi:Ni,Fe-hydrogenase III small subunit
VAIGSRAQFEALLRQPLAQDRHQLQQGGGCNGGAGQEHLGTAPEVHPVQAQVKGAAPRPASSLFGAPAAVRVQFSQERQGQM